MITNDDMDLVFAALAHQVRRKLLDLVRDHPGMTVGEAAAQFDVSRIAVMNHITVLTKANLLVSRKDGRARRLYLNAVPIAEIHNRWTDTYSAHWADRTSFIKAAAEAAARKIEDEND